MRGRLKQPTQLLASRSLSRASTARCNEPVLSLEMPKCPSWVSKEAQKYWPDIVEMIYDMGVMAKPHCIALGLLVDSLARYISLRNMVAESGYITVTDKGNQVQNPMVGALNKAWDQVMKSLREFGMTPSSLASVRAMEEAGRSDNKDDERAKYFPNFKLKN